jgi:tRNA(Ile)-lysidine synthase
MDISLEPGRYVVAVSGGVDSVTLLHLLAQVQQSSLTDSNDQTTAAVNRQQSTGYVFTVAHFDHGIREDSDLDQQLVAELARQLGWPYVFARGYLGAGTSEAAARRARYDFLHRVQTATGARAVVTAHHQDDLLETAVLNILRGTGRKGLSSLADRPAVRRPLLHLPKAVLLAYARDQGLVWREDSTNLDTSLTRNYVRQVLLPRLSQEDKHQLLAYIRHVGVLNRTIDNELATLLHLQPSKQIIDRASFIALPHTVAKEFLAEWLRGHDRRDFTSKTIERLVTAIKTGRSGSRADINSGYQLIIGPQAVQLQSRT